MDELVGRRKGRGGTSWDDGTYHGVRETKTFSSLNYPREHIFEDRREKVKKIIDVGLWGGNGGTSWDNGTYDGVRKITLVFGHCIDSIFVVYDKNGMPVAAEKHGGVGGNQTTEIKLQSPGEYLVSISGYYSPMVRGGSPVIRSLTFKSNKRTFGPFGIEQGTPFASPVDGRRITGFFGRSGQHLDAIGVHKGRSGQHLDAIGEAVNTSMLLGCTKDEVVNTSMLSGCEVVNTLMLSGCTKDEAVNTSMLSGCEAVNTPEDQAINTSLLSRCMRS